MFSIFWTAVLMILFIGAWSIWKQTMRDYARDKLFDLRDEWRNFYVENKLDMASREYREVRRMINRYLRHTNQFKLIGIIFFSRKLTPELQEYITKENANNLLSSNTEVQKKINDIRIRAIEVIQVYMVVTTIMIFLFVVLAIVIGFVELISKQVVKIKDTAHNAVKKIAERIKAVENSTIEMSVFVS